MLDNRHEYRDGQFVSQRVAQVVEAIREYCPDIIVEWVPPGNRDATTAAFRLIHAPVGQPSYVIFHVKTEEEFTTNVLKRLMMGDQRYGTTTLNEFEAAEAAAKAVARQRFMDQMEEANEIAASILASSKSTYKVNKDLVVKDYLFGNQASKPTIL